MANLAPLPGEPDAGISKDREAGRPKYQTFMRILWSAIGGIILVAIIAGGLSKLNHHGNAAESETANPITSDPTTSTGSDANSSTTADIALVRDAADMAIACNYSSPTLTLTSSGENAQAFLTAGLYYFNGTLQEGDASNDCSETFIGTVNITNADNVYEYFGLTITSSVSPENLISFGVSYDTEEDGDESTYLTTSEFYQLLFENGNITQGSLTLVENTTASTVQVIDNAVSQSFSTCVYVIDQTPSDIATEESVVAQSIAEDSTFETAEDTIIGEDIASTDSDPDESSTASESTTTVTTADDGTTDTTNDGTTEAGTENDASTTTDSTGDTSSTTDDDQTNETGDTTAAASDTDSTEASTTEATTTEADGTA